MSKNPKKTAWSTPVALMRFREEAWANVEKMGWKAPKIDLEPEITYFNNEFKYKQVPQYDLYFAYSRKLPLWDERLPKDNRRDMRLIWENIYEQEKDKPIPVLTSQIYGRPCRLPYDEAESKFRKQNCTGDFYRRKGGVIRQIERKVAS